MRTARRSRLDGTGAPALAALAAAALTACGPRVPPPDLSLDPAALLAQVEAARGRVRAVQGEARVRVDAKGMSGTVTQFLAAERPDRLHVEVLDFFGNPAMVLAAGGGRFSLYDARAKVYWRGAATPDNLARLVPLRLSAEELVQLLCGTAPLLPGGAPVEARPGAGFVALDLVDGARTQALRVGAGAVIERSDLRVAGAQAAGTYDVRLGGHEDHGGLRFPSSLELKARTPAVALDLRWRQVEVNPDLDPAMFHLDPPRGARVVDLDPGAEPPPDLFRGATPGPPPAGGAPLRE